MLEAQGSHMAAPHPVTPSHMAGRVRPKGPAPAEPSGSGGVRLPFPPNTLNKWGELAIGKWDSTYVMVPPNHGSWATER